MPHVWTNNAATTLLAPLSAIDTEMIVSDASKFPAVVPGQFYSLTLETSDLSAREIVHVTARAGNTLTVQRGQEGTVAVGWSANTNVSHRLTAAALTELRAQIDDLLSRVATLETVNFGGVAYFDEGVAQGTAVELDAVGNAVSVSVAGGRATLNVMAAAPPFALSDVTSLEAELSNRATVAYVDTKFAEAQGGLDPTPNLVWADAAGDLGGASADFIYRGTYKRVAHADATYLDKMLPGLRYVDLDPSEFTANSLTLTEAHLDMLLVCPTGANLTFVTQQNVNTNVRSRVGLPGRTEGEERYVCIQFIGITVTISRGSGSLFAPTNIATYAVTAPSGQRVRIYLGTRGSIWEVVGVT